MAKPGLTGLWQVSGRNDVDYDVRVYFDAWYVKNWSLWNDIAILLRPLMWCYGVMGRIDEQMHDICVGDISLHNPALRYTHDDDVRS